MKIKHIHFDDLGLDITYYIGTNQTDNYKVIDSSINPNDVWFHVNDCSSCHVLMVLPTAISHINKKTYKKMIKRGALLCKENTKKTVSMQNVNITYTQLKNVFKTTHVGSVITQNTNMISI